MVRVDRSSYKYQNLFKKWYDKPIFGVFHSSKFKNGRYGIVLDGPAIYFFEGIHKFGGKIRITAYTVQHELFHLKLWHKMTKEFPEMRSVYNKIPLWLHEADVIGNFIKANKQSKTNKWDINEILIDLQTLNKNLRNSKFAKDFNKFFDKDKLELKDFEDWDITKFLDKLQ